jgi:hypothetical protein
MLGSNGVRVVGTGGDRRDVLLARFPAGVGSHFRITSVRTNAYNCVAWAAGKDDEWWWPQPNRYWPPTAPRFDDSLEAFVKMFETIGYGPCDVEELEAGFEKVAIYVDEDRAVQHVARQLPNGHWTSKLGEDEDVEHALRAVEGDCYGRVAQVLKRAARAPRQP